jgi:hypothetical protein
MLITSFWHPDGKPMSAQQFIEFDVVAHVADDLPPVPRESRAQQLILDFVRQHDVSS